MIKPGALINRNHALGHGHDHGAEAGHDAAHGAEHAVEHASNFVSGFTMPGLLEIGTFVGFLGLFAYVSLVVLSKSSLVAKNDPYLEESLHHHVV